VTVGELYVPSALTALLIALVPVFMAVLGWLSGITARPTRVVWLGLGLGLAGVALLVRPEPAALPHPRMGFGVGRHPHRRADLVRGLALRRAARRAAPRPSPQRACR
jgi:drug/metabolite transporter (DMT)-like permease